LFTTAATLRDAMETSQDCLHLVTTNGRLEVSDDTGRETTYTYHHVDAGTRGSELARQFAICVFYARARAATGRPIVPAHVAFAQPAPKSYREFTAVFGTSRILFTGDVLCTFNAYTGRTGPQIMPSGLNTDTPQALASLANLDGIKAELLLPGHGDPWTAGVQDAIRRARTAGPS
jgi:hypothetical protein